MNKQYLIENISVYRNVIKVKANEKFKNKYLTNEDFWVEYDSDVSVDSLDYSIITIPFILNTIPIVWLSGEEYHVKFIDKTFADSLEEIRQSFQNLYPKISWRGKLIADNVTEISKKLSTSQIEKPVGILFSGGVDSFFTLFNNFSKIGILVTICGNDIGLNNQIGWSNIKQKYSSFGSKYKLQNTFIRSNIRFFLKHQYLSSLYQDIPNWWINVQNSLAYVGCSAPVLVGKGYNYLLVPSSYTEDYKISSGLQPDIDNKIAWKNFQVHQDGYKYSRQEKIRLIKEISQTQKLDKPELRVCYVVPNSNTLGNCCKCEKCLRTIIGILLEKDNIVDYGFNISIPEVIKRIKNKFTSFTIINSEAKLFFWQDIQKQAKQKLMNNQNFIVNEIDLIPFLLWLTSLNLEKYYRYNKKKNQLRQLIKVIFSYFPPLFQILYKLDKQMKTFRK